MPQIRNTCPYPLVDPTTGTRFESGVVTDAEASEWVKSQPALLEIPVVTEAEKKALTKISTK